MRDCPFPYTVKFDSNANDGIVTGTMNDMQLVNGVATNLTPCAFSKGEYQFLGWATESGGAVVYKDGAEVRHLSKAGEGVTLYAVWDTHAGVQLWKNGPYWAETNVGAEEPEEYGYYFWWGDTVGYKRVNDTWQSADGTVTNFLFSQYNDKIGTLNKTIDDLKREGWITDDGVLASEHDAAQVHWGNGWRMPTADEIDALVSNTERVWTNINDVAGYLVKGQGDYSSKSIFLPAAGYGSRGYLDDSCSSGHAWSSTPNPHDSLGAWHLAFGSGGFDRDDGYRYYGQSVRPLRGFAE